MKKNIFVLIVALCVIGQISAETMSHTFRFNESDFSVNGSYGDSLVISSLTAPAIYGDGNEPGIPAVSKSIVLSRGESVKDFSYRMGKRLLRKGVNITNASLPVPTNVLPGSVSRKNIGYAAKVYPDSNCVMTGRYDVGGAGVINFIISPFVYDAKEHSLYFVDSLTVDIELESNGMRRAPAQLHPNEAEILHTMVDNKADLVQVYVNSAWNENYFEYLIITCDSLVESFRPLAEWKRKKGVPSRIVTVEYIDSNYTGRTQQIRIKSCIKDLYDNCFIQYVLLGGGVEVVPTQPCYAESNSIDGLKQDETIPADVYYSCMCGDLDWDTNGNGLYGEVSDNPCLVPSLFVSRAPVRNKKEVKIFVDKILDYEQNTHFSHGMLQAGAVLKSTVLNSGRSKSDGEAFADKIYDEYLYGKWYSVREKFFEFQQDHFEILKFKEELEKGYQIVQIISHGEADGYYFSSSSANKWLTYCDLNVARIMKSSGHTLITTTACLTNAFDSGISIKDNECLGEAFFRNPNSGIIGYVGSSRFGFFNHNYKNGVSLDYSMAYEADFYKRLIRRDKALHPYVKNFGALLAFTKSAILGSGVQENTYRWLHYAINALGDPETPIFNYNYFDFAYSSACYNDEGILEIDTGADEAKVCVSSKQKEGNYYKVEYGRNLTFDTGEGTYDVWITKQNYVPKHFSVTRPMATGNSDKRSLKETEPNIESLTPNPTSDNLNIKYSVSNDNASIKIILTGINGGESHVYDVSNQQKEATIDIADLPKGIYIVNLSENGRMSNGVRVIKQ